MLRRLIRSSAVLGGFLLAPPSFGASLLSETVASRYADVVSTLEKNPDWTGRQAIYGEFVKRVTQDLQRMPANFAPREITNAAEYIELYSYLKVVSAASLTTETCAHSPAKVRRMSNAQAIEDSDASHAGKFLIRVINSVCRN